MRKQAIVFVLAAGSCVLATTRWSAGAVTVTYLHSDATRTPVVATDATGAVVFRENYTPYGERRTKAPAARAQSVFYGAHVEDPSGLVYMGARYYDPGLGRFLGMDPDPVSGPQNFGRYTFANNSPYAYVDPDGRVATPADALFLALDLHDFASNPTVIGGVAVGLGLIPFVPAGLVRGARYAISAFKRRREAKSFSDEFDDFISAAPKQTAAEVMTRIGSFDVGTDSLQGQFMIGDTPYTMTAKRLPADPDVLKISNILLRQTNVVGLPNRKVGFRPIMAALDPEFDAFKKQGFRRIDYSYQRATDGYRHTAPRTRSHPLD